MTKDARKCSHCGQNGHNSRTCNYNSKGIKLFGVRIDDTNNSHHVDTKMKMKIVDHESAIRRSKSLGNLEIHDHNAVLDSGYLSDGPRNRKKGLSNLDHHFFILYFFIYQLVSKSNVMFGRVQTSTIYVNVIFWLVSPCRTFIK